MFKPVVYNARNAALYDFSARTAFVRVEIEQPCWSKTEDHLVEAAAQCRRHVDGVVGAVIQYQDFSYVSKDSQREYESRAECIMGEALAASDDDISYNVTFEIQYKRNDSEQYWSRNSYATFDDAVTAAFDNQYFKANDGFSVEQLKVLKAVRELRDKQGIK